MKKLFLSLAFALISICAFSQVKVSINYPDVDVVFKRCIVKGNIAYVDFVMTNNSNEELEIQPRASNADSDWSTYDDEGNVYRPSESSKRNQLSFSLAGITIGNLCYNFSYITLPVGIPLKGRLQITGVDDFATQFILVGMKGHVNGSRSGGSSAIIQLKNIPITRQ